MSARFLSDMQSQLKFEPPIFIAGPCAVEDDLQYMLDLAHAVKEAGAVGFRGGAFKPRTEPDSFRGLGKRGLEILARVKEETGLYIVTEVLYSKDVELVAQYADVLQVGSRSMQYFGLLEAIAERAPGKTVLLKRGFGNTKEEIIGAMHYLRKNNPDANLMFCERGIRTFTRKDYNRFTLDVNVIDDLRRDPDFPYTIIIDPSHPAGRADAVPALARAGFAAGAQGLLCEVKLDEEHVPLVDGEQTITVATLKTVLEQCRAIYSISNQTEIQPYHNPFE